MCGHLWNLEKKCLDLRDQIICMHRIGTKQSVLNIGDVQISGGLHLGVPLHTYTDLVL